jgi:hypothetical protein
MKCCVLELSVTGVGIAGRVVLCAIVGRRPRGSGSVAVVCMIYASVSGESL